MMTEIPVLEDWENYHTDIDKKAAFNAFAGKSIIEGKKMFRDDVLARVTDLCFMPKLPFQYYLQSFYLYVKEGDFPQFYTASSLNAFIDVIEEKIDRQPDYIIDCMDKLIPLLSEIAEKQDYYEIDSSLYGDFSERKRAILNTYHKLKGVGSGG